MAFALLPLSLCSNLAHYDKDRKVSQTSSELNSILLPQTSSILIKKIVTMVNLIWPWSSYDIVISNVDVRSKVIQTVCVCVTL